MSWYTARRVLDGNANFFQNIPAGAVSPLTPAYDNSAESTVQTTLASGTPFTWSSGGGTAGAYGIVFVNCGSALMDLSAIASVTWGGASMISLGSAYRNNSSISGWGWVFGLAGIPGGSQTISVTLTQAGKVFSGWGSSYSYINASAGSLQTAFGSSTSPAVAVTAANSTDVVWGAIAGGTLSGFSVVARKTSTSVPPFAAGDTTGSTSVTVSATQTSGIWAAFGLDLVAVKTPVGTVRPVPIQTVNYTASAGQVVPCDLSGGAFSVTLPTAPSDGTNVVIKIIKQAVSPNTLTFNCGGSDVINVAGGATSGTLVLLNQGVRLQYASAATTGTVGIWYAISTDFPLSQSDLRYLNQSTTGTAAGITGKTTPAGAIVGTTDTQTLTNKTLTTPAISSPTGLVKGDVGLGNVDNTSDATKTATLDSRYEPLEQFAILQSAYTLTSQTALQQLLNTTTNGAVTLPVGDYFFECGFSLSSMSATSGSFGFGFGGTATFTQAWGALAEKASNISFGSAGMSWNTANVANLIAANTNTNAAALIRGRLTVTVAGTVIPQVGLTVAAAAIVGAGSYFRIQSVNSTAAFAGAWT